MVEKSEKKVLIMNRSLRTLHTSVGPLGPDQTIEVSADEAKSLLDYAGIVDASKIVPPTNEVADLRKENAELKAEIEELKGPKKKGDK